MKCPILSNWEIRTDGTCKRHFLCGEERHKICGAKPFGDIKVYSRDPKTCQHKYTDIVPTDEIVRLKGVDRKVVLVVCRECGYERRTTL